MAKRKAPDGWHPGGQQRCNITLSRKADRYLRKVSAAHGRTLAAVGSEILDAWADRQEHREEAEKAFSGELQLFSADGMPGGRRPALRDYPSMPSVIEASD